MLVWIAPRDMCALMATTKAQQLVRKKLSGVLSLRTSSPEILFAMTQFHKFYAKFYDACLQANEFHPDRHELVKVPALVFHILHSLGFCTYLDENGVERVARDKNGIPVCGDFWNAFRTAHSRTTLWSNPHVVGSLVAMPVAVPARIIETLFNTQKILSASKKFKELLSRLHALRPTRFAKWTGAARRTNYNQQSDIWEKVYDFWERVMRPLDQALSAIEKRPSEHNLIDVQTGYARMMASEDAVFLPKQLKDLKGLQYQESGDRRDKHALEWKLSFERYLQDLIVFTNDLKITLHKIMPGDVEMMALPRQSHGLRKESSEEAPTSETRSTAESRIEESSPSSASTEEIPNVPVMIGWKQELCFQRHGALKDECEQDEACYYRAGACRDKQPQMMRESRAAIYGSIADRERKTKPSVDMPRSHYALKQEELPPNTRKERKLSQKESENEKGQTTSKLGRKTSQQRIKPNEQDHTAYKRIKPPVVKENRVYCNIPNRKECEEAMDCMWDGVKCASQPTKTEDIRTTKTNKLSFPKPTQYFTLS